MPTIEQLHGDRIYLDANVFIYFVEGAPQFADVLSELFTAIDDETVSAVTSELTLAEVMVRPLANHLPHKRDAYARLLAPTSRIAMLPIDRATLMKSAELRAFAGGDVIDTIHVAAAQIAGCDYVLSEDRALPVPPPLEHMRLSDLARAS